MDKHVFKVGAQVQHKENKKPSKEPQFILSLSPPISSPHKGQVLERCHG